MGNLDNHYILSCCISQYCFEHKTIKYSNIDHVNYAYNSGLVLAFVKHIRYVVCWFSGFKCGGSSQ